MNKYEIGITRDIEPSTQRVQNSDKTRFEKKKKKYLHNVHPETHFRTYL